MKGSVPYILAIIALVGFLVLAVFFVKKNQERPIVKIYSKNISKEGSDFINDSIIHLILAKNMKLDSSRIKDIKVDSIEFWLSKNPFVKKADAYKTPKGELITEIIQKRPIVRIKNREEEYYITDEYEKIPLSDIYSTNALLVEGKIDSLEYKPLVNLIKFINGDNLLKKNITGVKKEQKNSFILKVNKGKFDIEFGNLEDFDQKFTKLRLFYDQYLTKVGFDRYRRINLQYKNQIVAEKK
ncbi:MAG: cell division protein FtsQ/DivIB [Flavobacteriales bacterium]